MNQSRFEQRSRTTDVMQDQGFGTGVRPHTIMEVLEKSMQTVAFVPSVEPKVSIDWQLGREAGHG